METYTTPEGFELHRPLLLPDARSFADVLEYCGEWGGRMDGGYEGTRPEPRHIPEETPADASSWERSAWRNDGRNEIGPYCTVDLSQHGGPHFRSIAVRATDATMTALEGRIVTPDDTISFRVIAHEGTGRALVIAEHGYIIGSHYLAYIDPATIPPYPHERRDVRARELYDALREAGHQAIFTDPPEPHAKALRVEGSRIAATIHADGTVTRTWEDGTISYD